MASITVGTSTPTGWSSTPGSSRNWQTGQAGLEYRRPEEGSSSSFPILRSVFASVSTIWVPQGETGKLYGEGVTAPKGGQAERIKANPG